MTETLIGPQRGLPLQRRRVRKDGWTDKRRTMFLNALADSCNVKLSAQAAGRSAHTAYKLRDRDPEFAAHWQAALRIGYERLETALLRRALRLTGAHESNDGEWAPDDAPDQGGSALFADMTVSQAMDLLSRHKANVAAGGGANINVRHIPTSDEVDELIIDRIAVLKRQRERLA
ncbi:hypothetical protein [Novosphingopyxis sp.]|uniref:hypothetical protein n=1 Tax=Novosphingopyxis sp. TaxID=2709690 RepID=UPI003B5BFEED